MRELLHFFSYCVILSLKKTDKVFKLIHLFIWLSLVNTEHLGLSAKHIILENLNLKEKNVLTRKSEEARKISTKWNAAIVKTMVILLINALNREGMKIILNLYWIALLAAMYMAHSIPDCTVDTRTTKHIAKDRIGFMKSH